MKKAFMGKAAQKYFDKVNSTVTLGSNAIAAGSQVLKTVSNNSDDYIRKLQHLNSDLLVNLQSEMVYLDDEQYEYLSSKAHSNDLEMIEATNYIINELETLLTQELILSASPIILQMLGQIRTSLNTLESDSSELKSLTQKFVMQIHEDDR